MQNYFYTRDELARACQVNHATINHWLNHVISPFLDRNHIPSGAKLYTPDQMRLICDYLGVPFPSK